MIDRSAISIEYQAFEYTIRDFGRLSLTIPASCRICRIAMRKPSLPLCHIPGVVAKTIRCSLPSSTYNSSEEIQDCVKAHVQSPCCHRLWDELVEMIKSEIWIDYNRTFSPTDTADDFDITRSDLRAHLFQAKSILPRSIQYCNHAMRDGPITPHRCE
jgi:hypothetical protein